jgi:hypothetical protein
MVTYLSSQNFLKNQEAKFWICLEFLNMKEISNQNLRISNFLGENLKNLKNLSQLKAEILV